MTTEAPNRTKNALEWTVFGISLILVVGTLGWLVVAALQTDAGPARLQIHTGPPETADGRVTIPVTVKNDGGQVAESVEVRVTLGTGPARQEATFTIDYIPRDATRQGAVSFQATDEPATPESIVVGYSTP